MSDVVEFRDREKEAIGLDFYVRHFGGQGDEIEGALGRGLIGVDALEPIANALEVAAGQIRDLRRRLLLRGGTS